MTQLVLQPCSVGEPMRHFEETVLEPVLLADHQDLLGEDADALAAASENGYVALWGIVPNNKVTTYERMRIGDRVLFVGKGRGFYAGEVTHIFHNPPFASRLWGHDEQGRTWEHMYSIGQGAPADIDGEQLNRAIGYELNAAIMGFTVLPEARSTMAFTLIDASLAGGRVRPLTVNAGPRRPVGLAQLTDPEAVVAAMAEYDDLGRAAFLRKYGFGPARSFVLVENGRDYDSKAVAGAALAYQAGVLRALSASEFSGGAAGAARKLRQLGFRVETRGDARPADQLTREAVQTAIGEFRRLGRYAFLARYASRRAERYVVVDQGKQFDAKAIIQAAWRHQHPDRPPLQANDFRGDRSSVAVPLRRLGFWVDDLHSEPQESDPPLGVTDPQSYIDAAKQQKGPTDRPAHTTNRTEQELLRGALGLYQPGLGKCDLCGQEFPKRLLIAAHIKKRADCSPDERRDLPHVGIRACLLGCDALFEQGWLVVTADGRLDAPQIGDAGDLGPLLEAMRGRVISCATPERQKYFDWHRSQPHEHSVK